MSYKNFFNATTKMVTDAFKTTVHTVKDKVDTVTGKKTEQLIMEYNQVFGTILNGLEADLSKQRVETAAVKQQLTNIQQKINELEVSSNHSTTTKPYLLYISIVLSVMNSIGLVVLWIIR